MTRVGCGLLLLATGGLRAEVVVETVRIDDPDAVPALRAGDRLDSAWTVDAAGIATRHDLRATEDFHALQFRLPEFGELALAGRRGDQPFRTTIREGAARVTLTAEADLDAPPEELRARLADGAVQPARVVVMVERALQVAARSERPADLAALCATARELVSEPWPRAALHLACADAARLAARPAEAATEARAALTIAELGAPRSLFAAAARGRLALALGQLERDGDAAPHYEQALASARARCRRCRVLGDVLWAGATLLGDLDRRAEALAASAETVAIQRGLDARHPELARRLRALSIGTRVAGRFADAEPMIAEAASILDAAPAPLLDRIDVRIEQGTVQWLLDREPEALHHWMTALDALASLEPAGRRAASIHNNLGAAAYNRGDLAEARHQLERARALWHGIEPGGLQEAKALRNLGDVAEALGDLDAAERFLRDAAALQEAINPTGLSLAATLASLGTTLTRAGRFDEAEAAFVRAMALQSALPRDCYCHAPTLRDAGRFELERGRPAAALARFREARSIFARENAGGLDVAAAAQGEAEALFALDRLDEAEAPLALALAQREAAAPDTADLAQSLHLHGRLRARRGDAAGAEAAYCRAADVLDRAGGRVGDDRLAESLFRAQYGVVYRDCLEAQLRDGDVDAAYRMLERSRARGFLNALQQRRLELAGRAPATLWARWRERESDTAAAAMALAAADDTARVDAARAHARALTLQHEAETALRRAAPRLAALLLPTGDSPSSALPEGTELLAWSVGESDTLVFRRHADGVEAARLPLGRAALRARVAAFRAAIAARDPRGLMALHAAGRALEFELFGPFAVTATRARLLLVSPDGPLHDLPFGALSDGERWLVERVPLRVLDTLLPEPGGVPAGTRTGRRLAVAEPRDEPVAVGASTVPDLAPLPAARDEVESIARLDPSRWRVLAGAQATEARLRALAPGSEVLHVAAHALLSRERPLESALVLHPAGESPADDGLLQAWEVLESLVLDARLVVLSACDTAQGREQRGEGLLGLTRAFRFAGAQSVLASLWQVDDEATAGLMQRFHRDLDDGGDPALAWRAAVRTLLADAAPTPSGATRGAGALVARGASASRAHPWYWAAFQLYGAPPD